MKRLAFTTGIVALLSLSLVGPVLAASPGNDAYAGREAISSLPLNLSVDTTEATTDADDVDANTFCGAPATDASVWYEYVAAADGVVVVDVSASDYSAGVIVARGSPGSFEIEACGPGAVGFSGSSGVTYAILVFDSQEDGAGVGGTLELAVDAAPPPPEISLTVDAIGSFDSKTGVATIRGTVTCSGGDPDSDKNFLDVQLTQTVGRAKVAGYGGTKFVCDGTTHQWAVQVESWNGKFAGGKAAAAVSAFACGTYGCGEDIEERTVTLRR